MFRGFSPLFLENLTRVQRSKFLRIQLESSYLQGCVFKEKEWRKNENYRMIAMKRIVYEYTYIYIMWSIIEIFSFVRNIY